MSNHLSLRLPQKKDTNAIEEFYQRIADYAKLNGTGAYACVYLPSANADPYNALRHHRVGD